MAKQWVLRGIVPREVEAGLLAYPPLLRKLLFWRGIKTGSEAQTFLNPDLGRDSHDPYLMRDMDLAVERVVRAVRGDERIMIFGDYDADGIPGAALLHHFFTGIGFNRVSVYIPDRYSEKYGLSETTVRNFAREEVKVLITVDCGITDVAETELAQSLGIDVIITDHHLPHDILPPALAVINAKRADDTYPFKNLCGAGTAWKLAQALIRSGQFVVPKTLESELIELATISTVADMVALVGENRALVREGLKALSDSSRPGLASLFKIAKLKKEHITEDDIAFMIGPRINISSRMSHGVDAFHLLTTRDALLANTLAEQLEARNYERRETVQYIIDVLQEEFEAIPVPELIVRGQNNWRIGVLGLTANRLMEKYGRPVCLWTHNHEGKVKGSIRSDGSVYVMELFEAAGGSEFFTDYGGHDFSGGFSLLASRGLELEERMTAAYRKLKKSESAEEKYYIDEELKLTDVSWKTWLEIKKLAPFGAENPKPVFLFRDVILKDVKVFGNGANHMELKITDGKKFVNVVGFFMTPASFPHVPLTPNARLDILANIEKSMWRNFPELRLRLVDLRVGGTSNVYKSSSEFQPFRKIGRLSEETSAPRR